MAASIVSRDGHPSTPGNLRMLAGQMGRPTSTEDLLQQVVTIRALQLNLDSTASQVS